MARGKDQKKPSEKTTSSPASEKEAEKKEPQKNEKKRKSEILALEDDPKKGRVSEQQNNDRKRKVEDEDSKPLRPLDSKEMLMERTETMSSLSALASPQSCRRKLFSPESMPSPPSTASSDLTNTTDKSLKDGKGERVSRAKNLTEEEKSKIAAMQKPSDMDYKERKRQYAALRRAIVKEVWNAQGLVSEPGSG